MHIQWQVVSHSKEKESRTEGMEALMEEGKSISGGLEKSPQGDKVSVVIYEGSEKATLICFVFWRWEDMMMSFFYYCSITVVHIFPPLLSPAHPTHPPLPPHHPGPTVDPHPSVHVLGSSIHVP